MTEQGGNYSKETHGDHKGLLQKGDKLLKELTFKAKLYGLVLTSRATKLASDLLLVLKEQASHSVSRLPTPSEEPNQAPQETAEVSEFSSKQSLLFCACLAVAMSTFLYIAGLFAKVPFSEIATLSAIGGFLVFCVSAAKSSVTLGENEVADVYVAGEYKGSIERKGIYLILPFLERADKYNYLERLASRRQAELGKSADYAELGLPGLGEALGGLWRVGEIQPIAEVPRNTMWFETLSYKNLIKIQNEPTVESVLGGIQQMAV